MEAAIVLVPTSCLSQLHVCLDCKITFLKYRSQHLHRQFTHPVRGATRDHKTHRPLRRVSIHAPRAGCDCLAFLRLCQRLVSIHAPRAGCDVVFLVQSVLYNVSIHAPRAGCDPETYPLQANQPRFQFTHPVRGATNSSVVSNTLTRCFNSRTPCGVRQLRADDPELFAQFQFTHPVRGATQQRSRPHAVR